MNRVEAPFTVDQVNSLNDFQRSGAFHPFTCGHDPRNEHSDGEGILVARRDGWMCPDDDYTQAWAHSFMADGSWRLGVLRPNDVTVAHVKEKTGGE